MNTTFEKIIDSDEKTLTAAFQEALTLINETVKEKGWRITDGSPILDFRNSSKSSRKALRNKINRVLAKPSMRNINNLHKNIHVRVSLKEEQIQNARKAWKVSQAETDKLLAAYKEVKGDFYKK